MSKIVSIFIFISLYFFSVETTAQSTNSITTSDKINSTDSSNKKKIKKFNTRTATLRSAMIPGWGQIYNKKYWKLPLVYGGLGITASVFQYNVKNYNLLRQAFSYRTDTISSNDALIDPRFKNLSTNAIQSYRT